LVGQHELAEMMRSPRLDAHQKNAIYESYKSIKLRIAKSYKDDFWDTVKLGESSLCLGTAATGDLAFSLDDLVKVLGKPDQKNDTSILYNGKLKATKTKDGIDIAFSTGNEGLFFAAGLFTSRLFTKTEGDKIIDFLDEIGKEKTIGRFKVKVSNATEPRGWRQASFAPKE
jgi:hypothetical protein